MAVRDGRWTRSRAGPAGARRRSAVRRQGHLHGDHRAHHQGMGLKQPAGGIVAWPRADRRPAEAGEVGTRCDARAVHERARERGTLPASGARPGTRGSRQGCRRGCWCRGIRQRDGRRSGVGGGCLVLRDPQLRAGDARRRHGHRARCRQALHAPRIRPCAAHACAGGSPHLVARHRHAPRDWRGVRRERPHALGQVRGVPRRRAVDGRGGHRPRIRRHDPVLLDIRALRVERARRHRVCGARGREHQGDRQPCGGARSGHWHAGGCAVRCVCAAAALDAHARRASCVPHPAACGCLGGVRARRRDGQARRPMHDAHERHRGRVPLRRQHALRARQVRGAHRGPRPAHRQRGRDDPRVQPRARCARHGRHRRHDRGPLQHPLRSRCAA